MSRSYSRPLCLAQFARNGFDDTGVGRDRKPWRSSVPMLTSGPCHRHDGTVRMRYRVHGDHVDGTFLAVDTTHAHLNMPATLMWARGLEDRPARITFERPVGRNWIVATQLHPTEDPLTYTAANLQYLMDSPVEFSHLTVRTFTVRMPGSAATSASREGNEARIRLALHHNGTEREAAIWRQILPNWRWEAGGNFW